jgi:hypothetical protein
MQMCHLFVAATLLAGARGIVAAQTLPTGFNYDEAKVVATPMIDPLTTPTGERITTESEWRAHRAVLLRAFEANVFGRVPEAARRLPLRYTVVEKETPALHGLAVRRQVNISLAKGEGTPVVHMLLYLPMHAKGPSPVILGLNFEGNASVSDDPGVLAMPVWQAAEKRGDPPRLVPFPAAMRGAQQSEWQVEMILQRGYGLATIYYGDIEPDFKDASQLGVRVHYVDAAASDAWGALSAWAWGLSRALDYLRTDKKIDAKEIAVTGHSRLGKAADWAAAQDTRFAALLSTESGKGGQSLYHRNFGETIAHLEHSFPYWFCANYAKWVDHDEQIPVDGNLLLALVAPRPLYVASAQDDLFSDPRGEFLAASEVGQVYALFGKRGLGTTAMPAANEPIQHDVAYHIRTGKHDVTADDWEQYLKFLDQEFGSPMAKSEEKR